MIVIFLVMSKMTYVFEIICFLLNKEVDISFHKIYI